MTKDQCRLHPRFVEAVKRRLLWLTVKEESALTVDMAQDVAYFMEAYCEGIAQYRKPRGPKLDALWVDGLDVSR